MDLNRAFCRGKDPVSGEILIPSARVLIPAGQRSAEPGMKGAGGGDGPPVLQLPLDIWVKKD